MQDLPEMGAGGIMTCGLLPHVLRKVGHTTWGHAEHHLHVLDFTLYKVV